MKTYVATTISGYDSILRQLSYAAFVSECRQQWGTTVTGRLGGVVAAPRCMPTVCLAIMSTEIAVARLMLST